MVVEFLQDCLIEHICCFFYLQNKVCLCPPLKVNKSFTSLEEEAADSRMESMMSKLLSSEEEVECARQSLARFSVGVAILDYTFALR